MHGTYEMAEYRDQLTPSPTVSSIPTELPRPPPIRKAQWATMLQEKKKHSKANATKLTGAEMSERIAVDRDREATNEAAILTHRVHIVGSSSSSQSISGSFGSQPAFRLPPPPPLSASIEAHK